jgi:hypothetical protein
VTGWYTLYHPEAAEDGMSLADRRKARKEAQAKKKAEEVKRSPRRKTTVGHGQSPRLEKEKTKTTVDGADSDEEEEIPAGRVKLQLLLQTSATSEFFANLQPQPVFQESLPPLALPQFLEDISEIKRLVLERLILAPIKAFLFALSWENPILSTTLLCWHVFVCYHKMYISASLWIVFLLLFWHDIPKQQLLDEDTDGVDDDGKGNGVTFAHELSEGMKGAFLKPMEGAKKDGFVGWARGMRQGFVGNVKHTTAAWGGLANQAKDVAMQVKGGFADTLDGLGVHGIGLQEFQHLLLVKPSLAETIRGFQPTVSSIRGSLQMVDDYFYWADVKTTATITGVAAGCLLISLVFKEYMKVISGYGYLYIGILVIVAKASFFKAIVAAIKSFIAVAFKSKVPFKGRKWFEATK